MPPSQGALWTTSRQILGNLIPLVLATPFAVQAVKVGSSNGPLNDLLLWGGGFFVTGWLSVNFFGLIGNQSLKRAMEFRYRADRPGQQPLERWFVGFAKAGFKGMLDPHQDVGFLLLFDDRIEFFGSAEQIELPLEFVHQVRKRANIHSALLLGGWVSLEGEAAGQSIRLQIEPREKLTLLGNKLLAKKIRQKIEQWLSAPS